MSADPSQTPTDEVSAGESQDQTPDESPETGYGELGSLLRAPLSRARAAGVASAAGATSAAGAVGAAAVLGRIVGVDIGGAVSVEVAGAVGARVARLGMSLSRDDLLAAQAAGGSVVLVFENGDAALPIIVGLLQPAGMARAAAAPDAALASPSPSGPDQASTSTRGDSSEAPQVLEADVDGKRVRITAQDEIVLECGSASITLRRNGRVVVRGTYVESYSDGTNRIKGGQVRIN